MSVCVSVCVRVCEGEVCVCVRVSVCVCAWKQLSDHLPIYVYICRSIYPSILYYYAELT